MDSRLLPAQAYAQAFERFNAGRRDAAQRADAFDTFLKAGFPARETEVWHYTDLSPLSLLDVRLPVSDAAAPDLSAWALDGCTQQTWLDGRPQQADSALALPEGPFVHEGLGALHRAFALPGLNLDLAAGTQQAQPLHALLVSNSRTAQEMQHLHHRIRLGRGARAVVILRHVGLGSVERWITHSLDIELGDGAQLQLVRVQEETAATTQWTQVSARTGRDAKLDVISVDLGGALTRNDWRIKLAAPGGDAQVHGLFAPTDRMQLDNQFEIEHAAPHCSSREVFRSLGFERSRSVLNGRVVVRPGAMKTDSEQRVASLVMSPGAEINAKPELEIYADDVKCAHGNTFGQLDRNAVFYLRSRGVPEATARGLLTYSFANEILAQIPHEGLRRHVAATILKRLGSELDPESLA